MHHNESELHISAGDFEITDLAADSQRQASLYHYYGSLLADEEEALAQLELRLDQVSAETEIQVRSAAEASGKKMTEGAVKATLSCDSGILSAKQEIIRQEHVVATLKNAVRALDQKGQRLADLVRLEVNRLYNDTSTIEATANQVRQQLNNKH